jgi:hypothetical protein
MTDDVFTPVLADWTEPDAVTSVLSLRIVGAIHRLVLDGALPQLAAIFPSAGGVAAPERAWPLVRAAIADHPAFIKSYIVRPPQTNEAGRSAAMLGGFLLTAHETQLPLRLLEIGASAGLNLFWDRYRTVTPSFSWGPPESTVTLNCAWDGPLPPLHAPVRIASRAACDLDPIDLNDPGDFRRLESYVWTDQTERLERLRKAAQIARDGNIHVEQHSAEAWLAKKLSSPVTGETALVYHSIFWNYLPPSIQDSIRAVITAAGARATRSAPLAWLRMELERDRPMPLLKLTVWPGGTERELATVHFHGAFVTWQG